MSKFSEAHLRVRRSPVLLGAGALFALLKSMRKNKKRPWICALLASSPFSCWAEVDLLTGGFHKVSWDPLSTPPSKIRHRRSYQSRSLHNGAFGFGWCSVFEKTLKVDGKTSVSLFDCEMPNPKRFDLSPDGAYNSTSDTFPNDRILVKNRSYERYIDGRHVQTFDLQGRLIRLISAEGNFTIQYDKKGKILKVRAENGETIRWNWKGDKVIELVGSSGLHTRLRYQNQNLIAVGRSGERESETYRYSATHNMVQNGPQRVIYNEDKDVVIATHTEACTDIFRYESEAPLTQSTYRERTCRARGAQKEQFRFAFRQGKAEGLTLAKIELIKNKRMLVYRVDEKAGGISGAAFDRRDRQGAFHE